MDYLDNHPEQPAFSDDLAKFVESADLVLADETGTTSTGNGTAVRAAQSDYVLELDVTAFDTADGDETLDVTIEESADGSTGWTQVAAFTQVTGTGSERLTVNGTDKFLRAVHTLGGATPSTDFTVKAV